MNRVVKYSLIGGTVLAFLAVGVILIVPRVLDVERYKPTIERLISEKTGLPSQLGGDITLSLFPWIALNFSDLRLNNPAGLEPQRFISIRSFEARLKTLPLLSKNVEISRFVIDGPQLYLVKNDRGAWNWEKPTRQRTPETTPSHADSAGQPARQTEPGGFTLASLVVGEFLIKNGQVVIEDQSTKLTRDFSKINLQVNDVSLDRPIAVALQAMFDGRPWDLTGTVGPLGSDPGSAPLPVDLTLTAFDTVTSQVAGTLFDLKNRPAYQLDLTIEPFNLRELRSRLTPDSPLPTADPKALERIAFHGAVNGTGDRLELNDGTVTVDDTTISLSRLTTEFAGPSIDLAMTIDSVDLDRYLPPPSPDDSSKPATAGKQPDPKRVAGGPTGSSRKAELPPIVSTGAAGTAATPATEHGTVNYEPLRTLILKSTIAIRTMRIHGGTLDNIRLDLTGRDGVFTIGSLTLDLYQGKLASTGRLDVRQDVPKFAINATLERTQVGPLLRDFVDKDILEGSLNTVIELSASGDRPEIVKASLNGTGNLLFQDGAIIGLDLARMARTITSGFSLDQQGDRPRTDFAELNVPLSITNGLVDITETTLQSSFIRARAAGTANLVDEALDLHLKPQLIATIKGQGDEDQHSGLTVPVMVGGTFSAPVFRPDLEALARERLPDKQELEEMIRTGTIKPERKEQLSEEAEKVKGLLKGLLGK